MEPLTTAQNWCYVPLIHKNLIFNSAHTSLLRPILFEYKLMAGQSSFHRVSLTRRNTHATGMGPTVNSNSACLSLMRSLITWLVKLLKTCRTSCNMYPWEKRYYMWVQCWFDCIWSTSRLYLYFLHNWYHKYCLHLWWIQLIIAAP